MLIVDQITSVRSQPSLPLISALTLSSSLGIVQSCRNRLTGRTASETTLRGNAGINKEEDFEDKQKRLYLEKESKERRSPDL